MFLVIEAGQFITYPINSFCSYAKALRNFYDANDNMYIKVERLKGLCNMICVCFVVKTHQFSMLPIGISF